AYAQPQGARDLPASPPRAGSFVTAGVAGRAVPSLDPRKLCDLGVIAGRAASLLLGSAQHGCGGDRRIAGLDPDIAPCHFARLDGRDRVLEGRHQITALDRGIDSGRPLRPPEPRTIDVGIGNALADPAVLGRPIADAGDALLMQLIVEERTVVAHDYQ